VEICKWDKSSLMVVRRSIYPECHLESGVFSFSTGLARADRNQLIEFIDNIFVCSLLPTAVIQIIFDTTLFDLAHHCDLSECLYCI